MKDTILFGDCKETLSEFLPQSARTCVTSPPYYGLRDYGTATWIGGDPNCNHRRDSKVKAENCNTGHKNHDEMAGVGDAIYKTVCPKCGAIRQDSQIGLEETPEEYIESLVNVFRSVRDVLTDDGTLWVNLGDSYYNYRPGKGQSYPKQSVSKTKQDLPELCNKRGNKFEGSRIIDGFLNFQKESVFINSNVWHKNHGSIAWNCYLHSFMWIKDVRAVGTNEARIFARQKIQSWIDQSDYLSQHIWDIEVMSKRIFYLLTNLSFFFETDKLISSAIFLTSCL